MCVFVAMIALGVHPVQDHVARLVLGDFCHLGLEESYRRILPHLLVEVLEPVDGADVDVVDGRFGIGAPGLFHVLGLFQGGHAADARAMAQMILVARTGALDEGDVLRLLAIRRPQDLAAGRTMRIGQALEFERSDHVGEAVVAIGLDFRRVVGLPAGGPDHGARLDFNGFRLHREIDGAVFARCLRLVCIRRADERGIEHVALRIGHRMRQVGRLHFVHAVVERVWYLGRDSLAAGAARGAVLVDVARGDVHRCAVVAALAGNRADLGQREHADVAVRFDAAQIDLEAASRVAELGEIAV